MKSCIIIFVITAILFINGFLFAGTSFAQVTALGNGLSCNGSSIIQKNKVVSYSKAKSNLKKTIAALKKSLSGANSSAKKKINSKIKAAQKTQLLITSCNNGQLADSVDPIFKALEGKYTGTYSGTVSGFIPVSGPVTAIFSIAAGSTVFAGELVFGGNLAAALSNKPILFSGDVGGVAFPAQFALQDTFLGPITASVTQSGKLTVSTSGISLDSQLSGSTISGSLIGSYSGISFNGSLTMAK